MMKKRGLELWERVWSSSQPKDGSGEWEGAYLEGAPLECTVGAVLDAELLEPPRLGEVCLEEGVGEDPAVQGEVEEACLCDVMLPGGMAEMEGALLDETPERPKAKENYYAGNNQLRRKTINHQEDLDE